MIQKPHKRIPFGPLFQGLVADSRAKHYHRMKNAVWLFLYLIAFSNLKSGKLIARVSDIAQDMGLPAETVCSWLGHLRKWHYVAIEKEGDGLLFKIAKWKNIADEFGSTVQEETPKRQSTKKSKHPQTGEQKLPSFDNPTELASHIADQLSEPTYQPFFENLCRTFSPDLIQQALTKVREVPSGSIKKSRGALFVYLVKKYAQEKSSLGN